MSPLPPTPARPLPGWLMTLVSALAVGHLLAVGLLAAAPPSGPWPTNFGMNRAAGPQFAQSITNGFTYPYYLRPLRMTHNYHFMTNRVAASTTYFEVLLKDDITGQVSQTLKFPDDKANFWVRHRQEVLFQGMDEDEPIQSNVTESVAGRKQKAETGQYWEMGEGGVMKLKEVPIHLVPKTGAFRPSEWTKVRLQAYMRHICREHQVKSVEVVRRSRVVVLSEVLPALLSLDTPPAPEKSILEVKSYFGEYHREK